MTIVRPTRRAEDISFRGSRQSGVDVQLAYERMGFHTTTLDAPTPDELNDVLRDRPAAIVHLTLGLVNHLGTAAIDLLAVARTKGRPVSAGRLTGLALDALIPRNVPSPLVILDAAAPKSRRESVTQLLLRNAFAADLVSAGNVRALIATGLAQYARRRELYETLIRALAEGREVGDIVRCVQDADAGPQDFERTLAFTATALFARTPDTRFPGTFAG